MSELYYTDAEKIKRLSAWHESEKAEIEQLKESNDRANLRIIAKDMQIAELTRMLFALGKQDGQTIRTQAAEIARLTDKLIPTYAQVEALERAK